MRRGGFGRRGQGGGHGSGKGGSRGQRMRPGSGGDCICPDCGQKKLHTPGIPCTEEICSYCGAMMVRNNGQKFGIGKSDSIKTDANEENSSRKTLLFPIVDVNLCTACGICIEKCPFDSIIMKDGKALIQNETCRKCMICVKECPENAIA